MLQRLVTVLRAASSTTILLALTLQLLSCRSNGFSGDGKRSEPAPIVTPSVTPAPTASPCAGDGITTATLITTSITSNTASQYLEYDIQLTDCNGNPKALANQPLKFDLNASMESRGVALPYELSVSDSNSKSTGNLQAVNGSDLFGNQGTEYAHWETSSISYASQKATIKLKIDVSQRVIQPITAENEVLPKSPSTLQTFLQLGNATPVQQNITLNY